MNSQFHYFVPQTKNNRKINRLHEKCLGITDNNKRSSFSELLEKDNKKYSNCGC